VRVPPYKEGFPGWSRSRQTWRRLRRISPALPVDAHPAAAICDHGLMEHVEDDLQQPGLADWAQPAGAENYRADGRMKKQFYESELARLQGELVQLQHWVQSKGLRVLVIFEGRGSAGKGGVIKRISERTSPRIVRTEALPKPSAREQTEWYFQRYVPLLPASGEIVLFDRSWYNRSNVEWVMGFCTEEQHAEFLRSCPEFERMIVRSGVLIVKYWFSVSYEEQERRFAARNKEPLKRWKLSDMDLEEHRLYVRYSMAKDTTFQYTDIKQAPWYVVPSDCKRRARLNCISHLLSMIPYENTVPDPVVIPDREDESYIRPPASDQTFVEQLY
jgi:polyphosphate kinase 2